MSTTAAIRALRAADVSFEEHPYRYEDRGGTRVSARELGVNEHHVVKTLVLQDDQRRLLLMLMHGDREVSLKALARTLGVKHVAPADAAAAQRATGYQFGGTSPFGTRQPLPIYVERSILDLPRIYVNGGARGLLVSVSPDVLTEVLQAHAVDAAIAS
ncbi:Cys-tRNA(Pro)/Cys-tRNA(Cys) deacylase YbaK [Luteitalea pratensis]|uniref:Cys-tRNA(Pro)/Cys-tRNA(Cys) deacylase n=1 Tax=Luteitalea pratensis TaxID=1855912 RepID=A0A143PR64_LUTPR|nr:Cys-tRNA(Pro) deacylase [Luteitalea pratensis]AMY10610.1 Cys-tRNA(Pro)/Cys-tRNA(Cys) deacylase YbaK [Luteitalea pratensis]